MQDGHCAMVTYDPGGESECWPLRDGQAVMVILVGNLLYRTKVMVSA